MVQNHGKSFRMITNSIIFFSFVIPLLLTLTSIIGESIPFSFDTARDFVQAASGKISLIGPPTGIPGIFYGPYWIWLVQSALLISKNPAHVALILLVLPYFIVLPLILRKFATIWGVEVSILVWLLFAMRYMNYFTSLWNPNLAPLLFWLLAYFALQLGAVKENTITVRYSIAMGILVGLILNIHLSFGIGIWLGVLLYCAAIKKLRGIVLFLCGVGTVYLPFIAFELRHGFGQLRAIEETLRLSIVYNQSIVGHTGLHPIHIIDKFFRVIPSDILQVSRNIASIVIIICIAWFSFGIVQKKIRLKIEEKHLLLFLFLCTSSILVVFLKSKNPVWEYHFIGVESILLIFFALLLSRLAMARSILAAWLVILVSSTLLQWGKSLTIDPRTLGSLATKQYIVDLIYQDIGQNTSFAIQPYSPSIYTYDYDYLIVAYSQSRRKLQPIPPNNAQTVYLVIPSTSTAIFDDFIHYRSPDEQFETASVWVSLDATSIVKRIRKEVYE